jgi:RND superfamily putative drug exporter
LLPRLVSRAAPVVILAWIAVVALALPFAAKLSEVVEVAGETSLPEEAESLRAYRELQRIEVEGGVEAVGAGALAEARAILVVRGLGEQLSPSHYWELREPYEEFRFKYESFSWIDVAGAVVEAVEEGAREALDAAIEAFRGADAVWEAYLEALSELEEAAERLEGLTLLVSAADNAYVAAYRGFENLSAAAPSLVEAGAPVEALCLELSPLFTELYIDVVRVEALLELHTDAYEEGLSEADISFVVLATNVPQAGLEPVTPEFVVAVYSAVSSMGGPQAFNNSTAAQVALTIAEAAGVDGEALELLGLLAAAWGEAASALPDLRGFMAEDYIRGQAVVASAVRESLAPAATEAAARALSEAIAARAPLQARALLTLYLDSLVSLGCSPDVREEALASAFTEYLEARGLPRELAEAAGRAAAAGDLDTLRRVAALLAAERVLSEAGVAGIDPALLASALLTYDPQAEGTIAVSTALARQAALDIAVQLFGAPREVLEAALAEGPREAAAIAVVEALGGDARELAERVLTPPPASREEALRRAAGLVAERIAEEAGIDVERAEAVAREALSAYLGEKGLEEALEASVRLLSEDALEEVIERLEGTLIEEGRRGFVVALVGVDSYSEVQEAEGEIAYMASAVAGDSVEVLATGAIPLEAEAQEAVVEDVERSDRVSSVLVLAILAGVLGTVVGVFLPFVGIGAALIAASAAVYLAASQGYVTVTDVSRALMISTGLGLGIDYAAYVSRRFRESLRGSRGPWEAAERAVERSWRPVAAGALAAAAGFGSLSLATGFPFAQSIGMVVPIAVLAVMVASLTLTPAILAVLGDRRGLWWPSCPFRPYEAGAGVAEAVTRVSTAAAPLTVVVVAALAAASLVYLAGFEGSFDARLFVPEGSEAYEGLNAILEGYDPGVLFPLYVVASSGDAAQRVAERLEALECVREVQVNGRLVVASLAVNPLGDEGVRCAAEVRGEARRADPGSLVGGVAAENLDLRDSLYNIFYRRVLPAAAALIFMVMLVFYASIPAALTAVATIAVATLWSVSAAAALGEALGVTPPWFLPIVVIAALLGVGMDYNSFYLNSAREAALAGHRSYYLVAGRRGAALVIGLALIMAGAYAGLSISSIEAIRAISLGLVLGVILAGVNSALLLTPAVMKLLGTTFWWPGLRPAARGVSGGSEGSGGGGASKGEA